MVIGTTKDKYKDIIISAISSVIPPKITSNEMIIQPSVTNKLRSVSIIKVDRIVTVKRKSMIASLGKLSATELSIFKMKFKNLVEDQ